MRRIKKHSCRATFAALASLTALAACGDEGRLAQLPPGAAPQSVQTILVATARRPGPPDQGYGPERSDQPNFASYQISVPRQRAPGSVTFPPKDGTPDPARDFLVASMQPLPGDQGFVSALNKAALAQPPKDREAVLFTHGYNTNFPEGLYRSAQLQQDIAGRPIAVHFAWPSVGRTQGYLTDRESVLFSRDALDRTIRDMGRSKLTGFNLIAHSMGTLLMMETLREIAMSPNPRVLDKVDAVVLISPDIDIDVFRKEAEPVLARHVPIFIVVSGGDKALRFSAGLRGGRQRLGTIKSKADLKGLDVDVIDLSSISGGDSMGHFTVGTSPALIAFLNELRSTGTEIFDDNKGKGLIGSSVQMVQRGTQILVQGPQL